MRVLNRCFKLDETKRTYSNQASYCDSQGGQIASIHSNEENEAIIKLISPDRIRAYIGAESDGNYNWKWSDGTTWWQPASDKLHNIAGFKGTGETRIIMNIDNKWHDLGQGAKKRGVVCAKARSIGIYEFCKCLVLAGIMHGK